MKKKRIEHSRSRGITSLEILGLLIAWIMITSLCATIVRNYYEKTRAVSAARHLKKVSDAACAYLKDNFSQFKTHTITNNSIGKKILQEEIPTIKLKQLIDQGYLPNGFSKKSVYSQEYRIQIQIPIGKRKDWQVWTTTEKGDLIDHRAWIIIGSLLKYHGFYQPKSTKKIINGLRQLGDNSITEIVDPGHIAFLQVIDNAKLYTTDSFIYRKLNDNDSPRPMQTSLRLDRNSITFKKSSKEVKLNNQSLELKNKIKDKAYIANLELLNKEKKSIPTLCLEESNPSDSKRLTINSSSLKIHRKPLFNHFQCQYDVEKKEATLFFIKHADQLHWSAYWNHIPYHQSNFKTKQEILQSANKICHYDINNHPRSSIGRLFIINSIQKIQIFICGKNENNENIKAYKLLTLLQPLKETQSPQQKTYLGKKIKGFALHNDIENNPSIKLIEFLKEKVEQIYSISLLEQKFYQAKSSTSTNFNNTIKPLNDFQKNIKELNRESTKTLTDLIKDHKLLEKKNISITLKEVAEKFIEYKKNTKEYMPQDISLSHIATLKSILDDLNDVLDPHKTFSIQKFFSEKRTKTYFDNLKDCSKFYTAWLPMVYVFSKSISLANPNNDHPFFETLYEEAEPAIVSNSKANGLYKD